MATRKTQADKFEELANELECDEDEAHWDERLKKVAKKVRSMRINSVMIQLPERAFYERHARP